jgi:hypothetical protein
MARKLILLVALTICTAPGWAQSSPAQTPHAGARNQTGMGAAKSTAPGGMHGMCGMGMSQQDMQHMQANLNHMHALLNSMRANMSSMDARNQPAMLSNIEMWQLMLDHMDGMVKQMQGMGAKAPESHAPESH